MKRYRCGLRVIGLWNVIGGSDVYKRARSKMKESVEMLVLEWVIGVAVVRR